jgi:5-deoxy-glucuronate isomerase
VSAPVRGESKLASRYGEGVQLEVTPEAAGWRYLSFRVHALAPGGSLEGETGDEEAVIVVLGGDATLEVGTERLEVRGGRLDVFGGLPHAAYVPRRTRWRIEAGCSKLEVAWGAAPATEDHPVRFIRPEDCPVEIRGGKNVTRQITHLVDPGFPCQRLLVVEVYTPSGNWSSYPPHKHDVDDPPREVDLEEVYYYRMDPRGFALQRLYLPSTGLDEAVVARDRDVVLVREGYHPVAAAPGYDIYYLNVLAGDHPLWVSPDDPDHGWVRGEWGPREPLEIPMTPPRRTP